MLQARGAVNKVTSLAAYVGMAYTTEGDSDLYVMRTRTAPGDLDGLERSVAGMGAISVDVHSVYSEEISAQFLENFTWTPS